MSQAYKAAVEMAAVILDIYREKYPEEAFPTIKGKLLPIIEAQAAKNGVDNIYVKRFKESMSPIVGQLRRVKEANAPYQPEEEHGVIILCPTLPLAWHRFVLVKEASHLLLDNPGDYSHSDVDVDNILVCIAQFGQKSVTKQFESEQRAVVCAIELLLPKAARDELLPRYKAGGLSPQEIAAAARVPAQIVRDAMSDEYCEMIKGFHPPKEESPPDGGNPTP